MVKKKTKVIMPGGISGLVNRMQGVEKPAVSAPAEPEPAEEVVAEPEPVREPVHHEPARDAGGQFREFRVGGVAGDPHLPFPVDPPGAEFARGGRQFEGDRAVAPGPGTPHAAERTNC